MPKQSLFERRRLAAAKHVYEIIWSDGGNSIIHESWADVSVNVDSEEMLAPYFAAVDAVLKTFQVKTSAKRIEKDRR